MKGPSKTRRTLQLEREFGRRLRACRIVAGYEEASDFAASAVVASNEVDD